MLNPFRTYRSMTRFLAMALFVASVLPFIQHACMMAEAHDMPVMKRCCCDEAHGAHKGMEMASRKCEEAEKSHDAQQGKKITGKCCTVDFQASSLDATTRTKNSTQHFISLALFVQQESTFIDAYPQKVAGMLHNTGPPLTPPLPLHILYSLFLN